MITGAATDVLRIAESAKEGLLALAVGTGLQVMAAMFAKDADRLCVPVGRHNPGRRGTGMAGGPGALPDPSRYGAGS